MDTLEWSEHVAHLAADVLRDQRLIRPHDFDRVVAVIAEEINVRLCLDDYPPSRRPEIGNS